MKTRERIKNQSKRTSSQDQQITAVYNELFPTTTSQLEGADGSKKKLQKIMWNHQQDIIIKARRNIHITNSAMNGRYANLDSWEYLMGPDGTLLSMKVQKNNRVLGHQVSMWCWFYDTNKYKEGRTKEWRKRVKALARKTNKSFKVIFHGMFHWIIQLFIYNLSARILKL